MDTTGTAPAIFCMCSACMHRAVGASIDWKTCESKSELRTGSLTPIEILKRGADCLAHGHPIALATVIKTWGSAPQLAGAQMLIISEDDFAGSVSGGCVESEVILAGLAAIEDGDCRVLNFGVDDETAFAAGLACGGEIGVLVEPVGCGAGLSEDDLNAQIAAMETRQPLTLITDLTMFERRIERPNETVAQSGMHGDEFHLLRQPALRLVIIGAVHIPQPLRTRSASLVQTTRPDLKPSLIEEGRAVIEARHRRAWP